MHLGFFLVARTLVFLTHPCFVWRTLVLKICSTHSLLFFVAPSLLLLVAPCFFWWALLPASFGGTFSSHVLAPFLHLFIYWTSLFCAFSLHSFALFCCCACFALFALVFLHCFAHWCIFSRFACLRIFWIFAGFLKSCCFCNLFALLFLQQ